MHYKLRLIFMTEGSMILEFSAISMGNIKNYLNFRINLMFLIIFVLRKYTDSYISKSDFKPIKWDIIIFFFISFAPFKVHPRWSSCTYFKYLSSFDSFIQTWNYNSKVTYPRDIPHHKISVHFLLLYPCSFRNHCIKICNGNESIQGKILFCMEMGSSDKPYTIMWTSHLN